MSIKITANDLAKLEDSMRIAAEAAWDRHPNNPKTQETTMDTITAPSGRQFTYEPSGGDPERIKALTELLCDSITADGGANAHVDNMFQAATSLAMELFAIDHGRITGTGSADEYLDVVIAVQQGLRTWITRNAPKDKA